MRYVRVPEVRDRRLVFYLAMEEYLARYTDGESFFIWRVPPTVIVGRNQVLEAEADLEYCRDRGIQVWRRKSGGGCVYADEGNIMVSRIMGGNDVPFLFESHLLMLALFLRRIGLDAAVSGRNDILVDGKKVSGNAFYSMHGRNVVHGTLLFDADCDVMERVLTPSKVKLERNGVRSVRQRVTNLKDVMTRHGIDGRYLDMDFFIRSLAGYFCDGEYVLGENEIRMIEEIEADYLDPDFISG